MENCKCCGHEQCGDAGPETEVKSMVYEQDRGSRLMGPHGGVKERMPSPTEEDQKDPLFNAIWNVTKTWDLNAPEYYKGYCGMNGSHVMIILNAVRALEKGTLE